MMWTYRIMDDEDIERYGVDFFKHHLGVFGVFRGVEYMGCTHNQSGARRCCAIENTFK